MNLQRALCTYMWPLAFSLSCDGSMTRSSRIQFFLPPLAYLVSEVGFQQWTLGANCCADANGDPNKQNYVKPSSDANMFLLIVSKSSSSRSSRYNRMRSPERWGWRKSWTRRWSSCTSRWSPRWGTSKLWICRVKGPKKSSRDLSSSWES